MAFAIVSVRSGSVIRTAQIEGRISDGNQNRTIIIRATTGVERIRDMGKLIKD